MKQLEELYIEREAVAAARDDAFSWEEYNELQKRYCDLSKLIFLLRNRERYV